jgi:hypothetical protein
VQYAVEHGKNPYNANIFLPEKGVLAYSDTFFGVAIPTLPLRWLGFSPLGVLNASHILGLTTMGAGAYLFARLVTGSRLAGVAAGATLAFGPFGAVTTANLSLSASAGIAFAAAAAWWLADRARDGGSVRAPAITLAAILIFQLTVSFYPGTYAIVTAFVVLVCRYGSLGRRGVFAALAALAVTGLCGLALAIPNLQLADREPTYQRSLAEFGAYGANFTRTHPDVVVWGDLIGFKPGEKQNVTFPGVTIIVLGSIGCVYGLRSKGRRRLATNTGLALTAVGTVLAIGTASTGARQYAPYRLLYELGPPFNALRSTGRAWLIALVGIGILVGLGAVAVAVWLRSRVSTRNVSVAVGVVVVGLLIAEGFVGWGEYPTVRPKPVDIELAARPEEGAVLYLPVNQGGNVIDLSYFEQPGNILGGTEHHRGTVNGLSGFAPPSYFRHSRKLAHLPDQSALQLLRRLHVRFVVVHPNVDDGPWRDLLDPDRAEPLQYIGKFGDDLLYKVPGN